MTGLPDPDTYAATIDRDAYDGHRFEWHEETGDGYLGWRALEGETKTCRYDSTSRTSPRCEAPAVAELNRSSPESPRWWAYCPDHLFGRLWHEGKVYGLRLVAVDDEGGSS